MIIFTVGTLAAAFFVLVTKLTELVTPFWVVIGTFGTIYRFVAAETMRTLSNLVLFANFQVNKVQINVFPGFSLNVIIEFI